MDKERNPTIKYCYDLSPLEYGGLLESISGNRKEFLKSIFSGIEERWKDKLALILTGSDGKRERHPQSKTAFIILSSDLSSDSIEAIEEEIASSVEEIDETEVKILSSSLPLCFYQNQKNRIYPDRILGADFLLGNENLFFEARKKVLQEMIDKNELGKRVRAQMIKQLASYRKTLKDGTYRNQVVFELNYPLGKQYYFEDRDWSAVRMGFKMGPLRAVQRKLDILVTKLLMQNTLSLEGVVYSFPSNTVKRFEFLSKEGILTSEEASHYSSAYLWFLREYHRVQEEFQNSSKESVVFTQFALEEFLQNRSIVSKFLEMQPPKD